MTPPRKFSALPAVNYYEASPKAISRRTSYLRVRLEFLPYPHLMPTLFNGCGFGPPPPFTAASTWTWIDHPVSGLRYLTLALLRLDFSSAAQLNCLTSPDTVTRRTVLQKVRGRTRMVLPQFVNTGFQVLFHSPPGVLFTFPSQYYALSVTKEYLALRSGLRSFRQGFSCLVVLWIPPCHLIFRVRDFHPLWSDFPDCSARFDESIMRSEPHGARTMVWALPISLAATFGIDVSFFSSGYLDVSVHRVPDLNLWIQLRTTEVCSARFPHSDIYGSLDICSSP